jgi:4'-phosphopantetheinyl transferase
MMPVEVWWAKIGDVRWELAAELDSDERGRLAAYARQEDKDRFLLGAAVTRRVLGMHQMIPPADVRLDRTCQDCGRPHGKVKANGMQLSVSHSGDLIGVAFHPTDPVGLDVEKVDPGIDANSLAVVSLAEVETKELMKYEPADRARVFTRYWTRKEAVVKATGDGMRSDLRSLVVSPPDQPAELISWPMYDGGINLVDLPIGSEYYASLAILTRDAVRIHSMDAAPLLRQTS